VAKKEEEKIKEKNWLIKHVFPPSSCKKQINKQNSYLLLALLQSGSVPDLDMHEFKHILPGQFVHRDHVFNKISTKIYIFFSKNPCQVDNGFFPLFFLLLFLPQTARGKLKILNFKTILTKKIEK
jgi:hypothetical protein